MTDLGILGGIYTSSIATAVNNVGQVAGYGDSGASEQRRAFLWQDGTLIDLGTLGGIYSVSDAAAVNNSGQIVGASSDNAGHVRATLWTVETRPATPAEELVILTDKVNALVSSGALASGLANGLRAKLDAATRQLNAGNATAARNILQAFINQVAALIKTGKLSAADGQMLIDAATNAINQLG
jgi:probable HAF family extracellular repeat protein